MLTDSEIKELVSDFGPHVNEGRTIKQIIADNDIPDLAGATVLEGKVSDSVFSDSLKTSDGVPIRLMFRGNRISTHDVNRGAIPFKDQVLAQNHDHMLNLVEDTLGSFPQKTSSCSWWKMSSACTWPKARHPRHCFSIG